ncbi:MAG: glycosyltransferase family 2 protein [Candidatus Bathyarchaeales archaeon]
MTQKKGIDPLVSILWLNYNSASFIELALKSLQGVKNLDYSNYELIIVDNNSKDGSSEIIKAYAEKEFGSKSKIIQLNRNMGFCGGNNIAYRARNKDAKYVVLLNSDAIPCPSSLNVLIEAMETDPWLGAAQGVIMQYKSQLVDNWGFFLDELLIDHAVFHNQPLPKMDRCLYPTYTSGAYTIYRIEAVRTLYSEDKLFYDEMFAYLDDSIICLKMWNRGWEVKAIPVVTAQHKKSESFKKVSLLKFYLGIRNHLILAEITNSRYKTLAKTYTARNFMANAIKAAKAKENKILKQLSPTFVKAIRDAEKLSNKLKRKKENINLYKAPIIKINPHEIPMAITLGKWLTKKVSKNS